MKTIDQVINDLKPMSTTEQTFKFIYDNNLPLDKAALHPTVQKMVQGNEAAQRIVNAILTTLKPAGILKESRMFGTGIDILIMTHPRFKPAIGHAHDFFEIMYVLKGSFHQTVNETTVDLKEGDFCFIAPNVRHNLFVFSEDIIVVNMLIRKNVFSRTFANLLSNNDLISRFFMMALYSEDVNPFLINHAGDDENIKQLIARMLDDRAKSNPYVPRLLRAQFEELFLYILRDHSADFVSSLCDSKKEQKIVAMLSYMQENYATTTLTDLADEFNYNPSYLSRLLRKYTGKSFSDMIQDLRFEHAIQQLMHTSRNIEDIIIETGYADRTFFYREFRDRYGMSPGDYRKNHYLVTEYRD